MGSFGNIDLNVLGSAAGDRRSNPAAIAVSAAVFLLAAAGGAALSRAVLNPRATPAFVDAEIARFAAENPGVGKLYQALEAYYPDTYQSLTQAVADELRHGDADGASRAAFEATARLSKAKAKHIAASSPQHLSEWGRSALALMTTARKESPALCAQVAFGDVAPHQGAPSVALADAVGRHAAATILAFHDGETAPHAYPPAGTVEQAALYKAAKSQGLSHADAASLANIRAVKSRPAEEQCDLGLKIIRSVLTTPEPIRTRILSAMAAEAAKQI